MFGGRFFSPLTLEEAPGSIFPAMNVDRFFIGVLAERTGLGRDTIRYYESLGVIPEAPRTGSGYRVYGPDDVDRLAFVGQAQTLGLTLDEIREILEIVGEGREPCVHVRERLQRRLEETRRRIRDLQELERRLDATLSRPDVDGTASYCRCRIIESGTA